MSTAAAVASVSVRRLQQAALRGDLPVQRVVGQTQLVDSVVLRAFERASRRGRRWGQAAAQAAIDLLDHGATSALGGSELSRLKAALRSMDAGDIAHRLGAAANWFRYRSAAATANSIADRVELTGPSRLADDHLASLLGLVAGRGAELFGVVSNLAAAEVDFALSVDGEGDIFLTQRRSETSEVWVLVDLFLMGEARESDAAAAELQRRAQAC